jgi:hypothetical protein
MKEDVFSGLKGEQVGEYNYNYWYLSTKVYHIIKEYYHQEKGVRMAILEKETRKGDFFVKLPHSLWVTKDGYPPLVTDAGSQRTPLVTRAGYFACLPTVQSEEHIKIFDDSLREGLREMGFDYDQLSKGIKEGQFFKQFPMTGFIYRKDGTTDAGMLNEFEPRVLRAYAQVLESKPMRCPIQLFIKEILGPQTVMEYHQFKNGGFDVPFSAQKAFFTIMMDFRVPPEEGESAE